MSNWVRIDGSQGEGGGQVLRTSLALAAALGQPVRIERVRERRKQPGLLRQHLAAVKAAGAVTGGELRGAELGSTTVEFRPGPLRAGEYHFAVGSAGSTTLVLQTVLVPLALAGGTSTLRLEGGTHNPWAPPYEFLMHTFLPQLARMGVEVEARLARPGFHPAGGGLLEIEIKPLRAALPLELCARGPAREPHAEVLVAHIDAGVARREAAVLGARLGWRAQQIAVRELDALALGPGNAIHVILPHEHVTEVVTAFGRRGLPAAAVARAAADEARAYAEGSAPVGEHLADQLLVPMALIAGGRFVTRALSTHTATNLATLAAFMPGRAAAAQAVPEGHLVTVEACRG